MGETFSRYRPLVDDWAAFLEALSRPLPVCVWAHPERIADDDLGALLGEEGFAPRPIAWRPGAFRLDNPRGLGRRWFYLAGLCHAQEEASMLPVTLLDPRPGERVLDLCAAPGGKTAQIALALRNRGTVVATEVRPNRMRALRANVARLGLVNVTAIRADGANLPRESGPFDKVLVDAPCSGEGTLRKRSVPGRGAGGSHWRRYRGSQEALLRKAVQLCRVGGRIVYSTCTFAPEENEAVVDAVLRDCRHYGVRVVEARSVPELRTSGGVVAWNGESYDPALGGSLRLWPHHNDTGGFFVTLLEKTRDPVGGGGSPPRLAALPTDAWPVEAVERFGIPGEVLDRYVVCRRTSRGLRLADRGHEPPARPEASSVGLSFIRTGTRHPKLTTAAAMLLARHASRNVVELETAQLTAYMARETIALRPGQEDACTSAGYVVVRHRGFGLGTGYYDAATRVLRSLYPKRWQGGQER